ncbi:6-phosphofructokinase [Sandaracinus amylolyticus]|uniref:6-phosphofructokinase n=1 Tax=Sandaracinus amylolyticus TaxID=927083 RepID=UPI001F241EA9|nr:6-phosphofructokinase [Sandaracinus amylolyticus]UJR79616.1 ATP-dependent 6-phosphofructokinase [Sandaracinus amylolyticus]
MRIGILTSGGDAPGMNMAVRAATLIAAQRGIEVVGIERGYEGLLDRSWRALTRKAEGGLAPTHEVDVSGHLGGSILGSARCKAFYGAEGRARAAEALRELDGLVVIGGNGSLTGAHALATEHGAKVIGIPASIDNDIGCTASAIGVDSALNTIVDACDRISDTARAHRRAFVVEVMGRQSGYLCMASAIAAGADAALFREDGRDEDAIVASVADLIRRSFEGNRGKQRVLVIKAEGVEVPCTRLVRRLTETLEPELGEVSIRATVLGHLVRGGNPTFLDRMIASRFALGAIDALASGATDEMVAWQSPLPGGIATPDRSVTRWPLAAVLEETEKLLDGRSPVTQQRVAMMQRVSGVLSI